MVVVAKSDQDKLRIGLKHTHALMIEPETLVRTKQKVVLLDNTWIGKPKTHKQTILPISV